MSEALLNGPFLRATLANFFFFLNFASYFLLPLFLHSLGGNEATIGAVMGCSGLASLVVLPLVGTTIDRVGRRPFLLGGAALMAIASLGFQFVHTIGPAVFALRILQGVAFAAAFTATTTFAAEFAPRARRARALGLFGLSTLLTHAIAPSLGEELVRRAGFPALFAAAMGCTLVVLIIALPLPEPHHVRHAVATEVRRLQPIHWITAATMTLAGAGFGSVMTFIPTFVTTHGLGRVAYFFAAYTSTAILTRLVGAGASDRFGRRRVILPALVLLGISIFWLGRVEDLITLFRRGRALRHGAGDQLSDAARLPRGHGERGADGTDAGALQRCLQPRRDGQRLRFRHHRERYGYRTMFSLSALTADRGRRRVS
jgi:MFS family permease